MASYKVEICLKKKKPTPSTNIPLLSYQKSEQQDCKSMNVPTALSPISYSLWQKKILKSYKIWTI